MNRGFLNEGDLIACRINNRMNVTLVGEIQFS